jgi:2,4-dienoyl-CoA reductase-like NADH-dependent reductase (Old Yellow Enzyme family)
VTERTLLTPLRIGGTTQVRNRLYRAPVLEGAGDGDDAPANYAKQFVANAAAGAGLIIQGSSCIYDEGRSSPGMTIVSTREKVLRFAPMVQAVQDAGAAIWLQVGHGGLFSMESWHEPYASNRAGPLLVASKPPLALRPVFRRAPLHVMTTDEVRAMAVRYGEVAAWAREAGYDGVQLGSSNAKLLDQFLSPFWNRRDDEFGGTPEKRASILRLIREAVAERAGGDYTLTVKIPVGEKAPPFTAHTTWDEGIRMAELAEEFGYDSVTPVGVSVFPDATLSRGGIPRSLWKNKAMQTRFRAASPRRSERAVLMAGYVWGGLTAPYRPVWNRTRFVATKAVVSIPVLAVGGIRDAAQVDEILDGGQADLVGIGRPFYAEPDLPRRILGGTDEPGLCQYSNLCVPAQMLGMKGACYNPDVVKLSRR